MGEVRLSQPESSSGKIFSSVCYYFFFHVSLVFQGPLWSRVQRRSFCSLTHFCHRLTGYSFFIHPRLIRFLHPISLASLARTHPLSPSLFEAACFPRCFSALAAPPWLHGFLAFYYVLILYVLLPNPQRFHHPVEVPSVHRHICMHPCRTWILSLCRCRPTRGATGEQCFLLPFLFYSPFFLLLLVATGLDTLVEIYELLKNKICGKGIWSRGSDEKKDQSMHHESITWHGLLDRTMPSLNSCYTPPALLPSSDLTFIRLIPLSLLSFMSRASLLSLLPEPDFNIAMGVKGSNLSVEDASSK